MVMVVVVVEEKSWVAVVESSRTTSEVGVLLL